MKFFHISDLHIGKRVCGFSMLEDQRYILEQILGLARELQPDGIWIAGDLYDKSMPAAEAVELLDWFLSQFAALGIPVWAISGNHDSAERVAYGGKMMEKAGIYVSRVFDGTLQRYSVVRGGDGKIQVLTQQESQGCGSRAVDICLLPFIRPAQVRRFFPDRTIETTQQAVEAVLETAGLEKDRINVLIMHQFLAGASVCESEELSVGGSDQVDASVAAAFDYVALGHLHGPQKVGRETVRYCGSPLKYSFSEAGHRKSLTVVELAEEKREPTVCVRTIPLIPRLDLREIKGPMEALLSPEVYDCREDDGFGNLRKIKPEDYLHVTLTDENEILDAIGRLRAVYPNIMRLDFEAAGAQEVREEEILIEEKTPQELFAEFFEKQNGRELNERQKEIVETWWQRGGEEE